MWTELLPAAVFAGWAAEMLHAHAAAPLHDRYIVGAGLVCANVLRPLCSGLAHLLHCTSATGYIAWWSCDYISISLAILTTASVYGRFAFYCSTQLQVLFFASTLGLLSTSLVAVLVSGDSSPVLRNMAFLLFCVFSNGTRPAHHAPSPRPRTVPAHRPPPAAPPRVSCRGGPALISPPARLQGCPSSTSSRSSTATGLSMWPCRPRTSGTGPPRWAPLCSASSSRDLACPNGRCSPLRWRTFSLRATSCGTASSISPLRSAPFVLGTST